MPYNKVSDELWNLLPPEIRTGVRLGETIYNAYQGSGGYESKSPPRVAYAGRKRTQSAPKIRFAPKSRRLNARRQRGKAYRPGKYGSGVRGSYQGKLRKYKAPKMPWKNIKQYIDRKLGHVSALQTIIKNGKNSFESSDNQMNFGHISVIDQNYINGTLLPQVWTNYISQNGTATTADDTWTQQQIGLESLTGSSLAIYGDAGLEVRNNTTVDCIVDLYALMPKRDTSITPTTALDNGMADLDLGTTVADADPFVHPSMSATFRQLWKIVRHKRLYLKAADSATLTAKIPYQTFNHDFFDDHNETYRKGKSLLFGIRIRGTLAHDSTNVDTEIGYMAAGIDYMFHANFKCRARKTLHPPAVTSLATYATASNNFVQHHRQDVVEEQFAE